MDYHYFKDLLNRYYLRHVGGISRPVFFDIPSVYPELQHVTEAFPGIKSELEELLQKTRMPRYHEIDRGETEISASEDERNWSVFMLEILGHRPSRNRAKCPQTCRALAHIPNLIQAFFSILDPGKSIPEHKGPYLGYLRYHLALRVPSDHPPALIVGSQRYEWKMGQSMLFDDSWPHRVENQSADIRAVLVVDVLRPMPIFPSLVNRFTTNVVARHTYGRSVARNVKKFAA